MRANGVVAAAPVTSTTRGVRKTSVDKGCRMNGGLVGDAKLHTIFAQAAMRSMSSYAKQQS